MTEYIFEQDRISFYWLVRLTYVGHDRQNACIRFKKERNAKQG